MQRKILNKTYDFHVNNLYEQLNILTLKKLFYKTSVTYLIKNLINPIFYNFNARFKLNNIITLNVHKSTTQSSFLFTSPKIYNTLPHELRDYTK